MAAVTAGVAALVAINGFRADVARAIHRESRALLGADLELASREPFPDSVRAAVDSLAAAGLPVSDVTSFGSMALATRTGAARLVEVRAVTGGFPFYGTIETAPAGRWDRLQQARRALVDPTILVQLNIVVGDTLAIGESRFVVDGVLTRVPGEVALRAALGPRVYIPGQFLAETGLLRFGSRARYATYLAFSSNAQLQDFINHHVRVWRATHVGFDTASEREQELSKSLDMLARYLGLVGLVALLLGGVGVASAVHVYIKDKLDTVAVLRCLGAERATVFGAYLLQAALLGFSGAAVGVALGLLVQAELPRLLGDFLPLPVGMRVDVASVAVGLFVGVWVAVAFGLLPLLQVRRVSPLAALRRDYETTSAGRDPLRLAALVLLGVTVVALAVWQAPNVWVALGFTGGILATTLGLGVVAWMLTWAARRYFPRRAPYVVRQGVANLFRPHNQTLPVVLAVGFGVFLLGVVAVVQRNLLQQLTVDVRPDRPNLVAFDVQQDQRDSVLAIFHRDGAPVLQTTPIVPARIYAVNGVRVTRLLADSGSWRRSRWPLRREYRNTYRDTLVGSETVVAGTWHDHTPQTAGESRISVEEDLASELRVGIGDHLTWDVQGVLIESVITSLRHVEWARFEPNFFVVFEPGALETAPQTWVALTRVDADVPRARIVSELVRRYPNIAAVDLTDVIRTLDQLLGTVALAIRFMALFSLASGVIVLLGAVATSRFQRTRESVLLKTLGARAPQVRVVLLTEYAALGGLAGLTGTLLAGLAGWGLVRFFFQLRFRAPLVDLTALGIGAAALTVLIGLLSGRRALQQTPLAALREMGE